MMPYLQHASILLSHLKRMCHPFSHVPYVCHAQFPGGMDEALVVTIARDVLRGLEYLHRHELAHRDLKVRSSRWLLHWTLQGFVHIPRGFPEYHSKPERLVPQVTSMCHFALLRMLTADMMR